MSDYVDFKAIKSVVTVASAASRFGVELRRVNASHERGKCPLPGHPKGDTGETFSVNVEKQVWICHSAACAKSRKGKKGGDVIELVAAIENCSLREAGVKLGQWFSVTGTPAQVAGQSNGAAAVATVAVELRSAVVPDGSDFGIYAELAEWVQTRINNVPKSKLDEFVKLGETAAFVAVLSKIEELAERDYQTRKARA